MTRRLRWALIALLLASCSQVRIGYPFLAMTLRRSLADYVPIDESTHREVDHYRGWHKQHMLPAYSKFLRAQVAALGRGPITRGGYDEMRGELDRLFSATLAPIADIAAGAMGRLRPSELATLSERLIAKNQELRESIAEDQKDPAKRLTKTRETFEELVGPLRPEQWTALEPALMKAFSQPELWLKERERRGEGLVRLLQAHKPRAAIAEHLLAWWSGARSTGSANQSFVDQMYEAFFGVLSTLDEAQRTSLSGVLEKYAEDFDSLGS